MLFRRERGLNELRALKSVDDAIKLCTLLIIEMAIKTGDGIAQTQKNALHNIRIVGSVAEGASTARLFKSTDVNEVEFDMEYTLLEFPAEYKHTVEDIPENVGYVRIKFEMELLALSRRIGWRVEPRELYSDDLRSNDGYLKSYVFKEKVLEKTRLRNDDKNIELIIAATLNLDPDDVSLSALKQTVTGASVDHEITIYTKRKPLIKLCWDVATVFRILWWPEAAQEWKDRERKWPCKETIVSLSQHAYLIGKPSDEETSLKESVQHRYSFAHVERSLVEMRSEQQNFVYFVFKSMLYEHLKPLHGDRVQSYFAKTVMFWVCEQHPPDDQIWVTDDVTTLSTLTFLFEEMLASFESGEMQYYFIPSINVIAKVNQTLRLEIIGKIKDVIDDIGAHLPENVDMVTNLCESNLNVWKQVLEVTGTVTQDNWFSLVLSSIKFAMKRKTFLAKLIFKFRKVIFDTALHAFKRNTFVFCIVLTVANGVALPVFFYYVGGIMIYLITST